MCALDLISESVYTLRDSTEDSTPEVVPSYPTLSVLTRYIITSRQASESAWIFFTSDPTTFKPLVMKVLRPFRDIRYDLSGVTERQRCQFEAFQQNSVFTPEVYIGLACLHNQPSEEDYILIGDIIKQPTQAALEQDAEYALIMERLPDDRRFDQLLQDDEGAVQNFLDTLTCHIANLHKHRTPSLTEEESAYWGSYPQLQRKLEENLAFLALVLDKENSPSMKATVERLTTGLRQIFTEDLNPLFRNIDILSDFAMLVIDVRARTCSATFARRMIDNYLQLTHQDDTPTWTIFTFYLVEKAIVAAAINILFDNQLELGLRLLHLAQEHLNLLVNFWLYQPA